MIKYNPAKPLISLHIPKCAGRSLHKILKKWFAENFFTHYFQRLNALPQKYELKPGICIHGHFNNTKGFGVQDYYPQVDQLITFLRNPLEAAISNYFFWKKKGRYNQLKLGKINEGGEHDYRDINDFFEKRPLSHIQNFLPPDITGQNFKEVLTDRFVYIGIVEDMKTSLEILARKLGFEPPQEIWINKSERDEELTKKTEEKYIANNRFAFEIYEYALKTYKLLT